jgi:predicted ribosomally synthesized peptide with SipW-like signal peptide
MHRLLLSLAVLVFAGATVIGGTGAFFSDEERSEGNVFAAGALDLKVDSVAHYNGLVCFDGLWHPEEVVEWDAVDGLQLKDSVTQQDVQDAIDAYNDELTNPMLNPFILAGSDCDGTWEETDLGPSHTFFDFTDLKPGDHGENTLSLHVYDNDAYACAVIDNMVDTEVGTCSEPEEEDGDTSCEDGDEGELSEYVRFLAWDDDGDNIWEDGEQVLFSNTEGPASDVLDGVSYPLYTPQTGPLQGTTTEYIGLYWCFGDIIVDENNYTLSCDGAPVDNVPQSDSLMADITFYVEQARNNENFVCPLPNNGSGDDDDDDLLDARTVVNDGWSPVDLDDLGGDSGKEWFAKSRNNNGGFEVAVGTTDAVRDDANTTWTGGVAYPFTLAYDHTSGMATYSAGGVSTTFLVGPGAFGRIGVNVKAPTGVTTSVADLVLDIANPLASSAVSVSAGTRHLLIDAIDLSQDWVLTGTHTFSDVGGAYSDENPAVQFSID